MVNNVPRLVIAGYFGFKNTGDEAILAGMIHELRGLRADATLTVLSGDLADTSALHYVKAVAWKDVERISAVIKDSTAVILGGGGLFHDYWGMEPADFLTSGHTGMAFYASVAALASMHGRPLVLYGIGAGPLAGEHARMYARAIGQQASLITVRDAASRDLLAKLGLSPDAIRVTADAAFCMPQVSKAGATGELLGERPAVGVAVRKWDVAPAPDGWERELARVLDNFLDDCGGQVLFIPFQDSREPLLDDVSASKRIRDLMKNGNRTVIVKTGSTPQSHAAWIARCDLVLGMRLHAVVLAINNAVPVVGLAYDPKVAHMLAQAGLPGNAVELRDDFGAELARVLKAAFETRVGLKDMLSGAREVMRANAKENARLAIELIETSGRRVPPTTLEPLLQSYLRSIDSHLERQAAQTRAIAEHERTAQRMQNKVDIQARDLVMLKAAFDALAIRTSDLRAAAQEAETRAGAMASRAIEAESRAARTEVYAARLRAQTAGLEQFARKQQAALQVLERESKELAGIKVSRGWHMLSRLWQLRLRLIPAGSAAERVLRRAWDLFVSDSREFMRRTGRRMLPRWQPGMSAYAFAFDRFKRARARLFRSDLRGLHVPGVPGLVSVILPVYNGAAMVTEALDSILAQTYANFELIVVDDGSVDGTGALLDDYARRDNRIRVIHQKNSQLPQALNRGFACASGQYLTWTSHDNRLKPAFLQRMVESLDRHPEWDMVYADMDMITQDGSALRGSDWYAAYQRPAGSQHVSLPRKTSELNTFPNNFVGGAFLYRNRIPWLLGEYNPRQFTREDYDYWMRTNALMTLKHAGIGQPLYEYRFHSKSLTHSDEALGITRERETLMILDDFRRDFHLTPQIWVISADESAQLHPDVEKIRSILNQAEQIVKSVDEFDPEALPKLWMPCVYLRVTTDPSNTPIPPVGFPSSAAMVLLSLSSRRLPSQVSEHWDVCLACGPAQEPLWLDGQHRGWLIGTDLQTLISAIDIRSRSRHLELIERESVSERRAGPAVSVVICTYRRGSGLKDTLRAIARQTLPQNEYEVLVVDNHPEGSDAASIVSEIRAHEFSGHPDRLRTLRCPVPGLSHARNAGLAEARGELLLFLDDDAVAEENLLDELRMAFEAHPNAGVVGGHIHLELPAQLQIPWKHGWERYWSQFVTGYEGYTVVDRWWEFPWGANWCARRTALLQVGGFRGRLGRRGNDFGGGEEIVAASLIQRLGYSIAVLPQARVSHRVDPERFTLHHLKHTIRAGLLSQYQAQLDLHLPMETNFRGSLTRIASDVPELLSPFVPGSDHRAAQYIEAFYYLSGRSQLLRHQLSDGLRRLRKPIAG